MGRIVCSIWVVSSPFRPHRLKPDTQVVIQISNTEVPIQFAVNKKLEIAYGEVVISLQQVSQ